MLNKIIAACSAASLAASASAQAIPSSTPAPEAAPPVTAAPPTSAPPMFAPVAATDPLPEAPQLVVAAPTPPASHPDAVAVPRDTMVRLMVLNEVNTHKAKAGDRFILRVDEDVRVSGITVIPVGAKAYGEVTAVRENGAVGKAGTIGARLLYAEVGEERIPLTGEEQSRGNKGGDRVALAVIGFGVLGLLARGSQGKLKAGHIFNGYIADDLFFDPATRAFVGQEAAAGRAE